MSQLKTITDLANVIGGISANITLGKFIRWIIVLLIFSSISIYIFNNILDNSAYYNQINQRINIIQNISQLPYNDSIVEQKTIEQLSIILDDLNRQPIAKEFNVFDQIPISLSSIYIKKLLISSILPLLIGLIVYFTNKNDTDTIVGMILILPIISVLSSFLPLISNSFIIYSVVTVILQIILFAFLAYWGNKE